MTDYTITTNFGAKDSLPSGNAGKVIKGEEFTTEFTNIQTAVNTKADTAGDTFTGAVNFSADVAVNTNTLFVDVSEAKVGIGTTSPAVKLHIDNGATSDIITQVFGGGSIYSGVGVDGTGAILTAGSSGSASASMQFRTAYNGSEAERMRIDSSGNLLVGTTNSAHYTTSTTSGHTLFANGVSAHSADGGSVGIFNRRTSDGTIIDLRKDGTTVGSISVTASATAYNTSSDERLKENITDSADAGSKVDAIQIRQFDWKADGSHQDYGVIAQELVEVAPEAVAEGDTEEEMMGVDYSKLVPMLIKEVQSLRSRVAELENV